MTCIRDAENMFSLSPLSFCSSSKQRHCHGLHYVLKSVTVNGLLFLRGKIQPPACKTNAAWNTFKHEQRRGLFYIRTIQSITVSFFAPAFSKHLTTIYCQEKAIYFLSHLIQTWRDLSPGKQFCDQSLFLIVYIAEGQINHFHTMRSLFYFYCILKLFLCNLSASRTISLEHC